MICTAMMLVVLGSSLTKAIGNEQIISFDSQITISRDNVAEISETIVYDFSTNSRHGIYRDIPVDYRDGKDTYYLGFKLDGVWDDNGASLKTEVSTVDGNKRIKIGDADKTITGIHTYQISYELSPIVTEKNGKPFLNLDVVGEGWAVPISNITASIVLDGEQPMQDVVWYGANNLSSDSSKLEALNIPAYKGITINANLPDGYVSTFLEPNKPRLEDTVATILLVASVAFGFLLAIGVVGILIARALRNRKRRKNQTIIPEYEPPEGLSPAHIGLLQDDTAGGREITATIINWAVSGYIKVAYLPKKGLFGKKDYQLIVQRDASDLPTSELALFNAILDDAKEIKLSDLDKQTVASQVIKFEKDLKDQLADKGYYDKEGHIFMRGTLTENGAKEWAKVDGFRLYLSVAEKDRLKFSDAPDKTPERFNTFLPYAIALGVEKEWAKQFEGINLTESTTWYSGNLATFSAVALVSNIGGSFASVVSSNSSVSSSGGSSGGGFGGGGGGSW